MEFVVPVTIVQNITVSEESSDQAAQKAFSAIQYVSVDRSKAIKTEIRSVECGDVVEQIGKR